MSNFLISFYGWGSMMLRLVLGLVFVVHGWPKIKDPRGIAQAAWGGRTWLGLLQGLAEGACGLALIFGFQRDIALLLLIGIILGALFFKIVKWKVPFMAKDATGWEFDLLVLAGLLTLLLG